MDLAHAASKIKQRRRRLLHFVSVKASKLHFDPLPQKTHARTGDLWQIPGEIGGNTDRRDAEKTWGGVVKKCKLHLLTSRSPPVFIDRKM